MRAIIFVGMAVTAMVLGGCNSGTSDGDHGTMGTTGTSVGGSPGMDVPSQSGRQGAGVRNSGEAGGGSGNGSGGVGR